MKPLFGAESELAIVGQFDSSELITHAGRTIPSLRGVESGYFIQGGGRLYSDCSHPEWATPEVTNPQDAVRYLHGGELLLADTLDDLAHTSRYGGTSTLHRTNIDYLSSCTWGCHESYCHGITSRDTLRVGLLPFLASRVIFTGAGGFDLRAGGVRYCMSPRGHLFDAEVSDSSTCGRGMVHTKNEPLTGQASGAVLPGRRCLCSRLHLLGESVNSRVSAYLRFGTTALVLGLLEARGEGVIDVRFANARHALVCFSSGLESQTRMADVKGREWSAVELQRYYLRAVRHWAATRHAPDWAEDVCLVWERVLDLFEQGGPEGIASLIDWAAKLMCYRSLATDLGLPPQVLAVAAGLRFRRLLDIREVKPSYLRMARSNLARAGLNLEQVVAAIPQFLELDLKLSLVGEHGLWEQFRRSGLIDDRLPGLETITAADALRAPEGTRAAARSAEIMNRQGQRGFHCSWDYILNASQRRVLDLSDPWNPTLAWYDRIT